MEPVLPTQPSGGKPKQQSSFAKAQAASGEKPASQVNATSPFDTDAEGRSTGSGGEVIATSPFDRDRASKTQTVSGAKISSGSRTLESVEEARRARLLGDDGGSDDSRDKRLKDAQKNALDLEVKPYSKPKRKVIFSPERQRQAGENLVSRPDKGEVRDRAEDQAALLQSPIAGLSANSVEQQSGSFATTRDPLSGAIIPNLADPDTKAAFERFFETGIDGNPGQTPGQEARDADPTRAAFQNKFFKSETLKDLGFKNKRSDSFDELHKEIASSFREGNRQVED